MGMGMGNEQWEWEGMGIPIVFPHTSSTYGALVRGRFHACKRLALCSGADDVFVQQLQPA